jgi:hypothetical protein
MNNDAFEKAWTELTAPQNETVTSKWYFKQGYKAAEKRLLLSQVQMPERKPDIRKTLNPDVEEMIFFEGFNECLDQIKLIPLTSEQVDSLLPSDEDISNYMWAKIEDRDMGAFKKGCEWLRDCIKKRLGGV